MAPMQASQPGTIGHPAGSVNPKWLGPRNAPPGAPAHGLLIEGGAPETLLYFLGLHGESPESGRVPNSEIREGLSVHLHTGLL